MTKFTPPPWHVEGYSIERKTDDVVDLQKFTVSTVTSDYEMLEAVQANAHLIATAPDMYELLERIRSYPLPLELIFDITELLDRARGES